MNPLISHDVQLVKVERVDDGFQELDLGPMVRVSIRSNVHLYRAFDVTVMAGLDGKVFGNSPAATVRIDGIAASELVEVDVRLPASANAIAYDKFGQPIAADSLFSIVDSRNEILELNEVNNVGSVRRYETPFVELVVGQVEPELPVAGGQLTLGGEGFANATPKVLAIISGFKFNLPVVDHSPYGVIVELPDLTLLQPVMAQVIVVREDGRTSTPVNVWVNP